MEYLNLKTVELNKVIAEIKREFKEIDEQEKEINGPNIQITFSKRNEQIKL